MHLELATRLVLQPPDLLDDVAGEQRRARPRRLAERLVATYLGPVVERGGHGIVRVGDQGPEGGEDLVGLAPRRNASAWKNQPVTACRSPRPRRGTTTRRTSNPSLGSSSGPPGDCMTPSSVRNVVTVSRMRTSMQCPTGRMVPGAVLREPPALRLPAAEQRSARPSADLPASSTRRARPSSPRCGAQRGELGRDAAPLEVGRPPPPAGRRAAASRGAGTAGVVAARPEALDETGRPRRRQAQRGRVVRDGLEVPVPGQHGGGRLRSPARDAGKAVGRVAHQREPVRGWTRAHAVLARPRRRRRGRCPRGGPSTTTRSPTTPAPGPCPASR